MTVWVGAQETAMADDLDQTVLALANQVRSHGNDRTNRDPGVEEIEQVGIGFCVSVEVDPGV